jgi:hypothetical protein
MLLAKTAADICTLQSAALEPDRALCSCRAAIRQAPEERNAELVVARAWEGPISCASPLSAALTAERIPGGYVVKDGPANRLPMSMPRETKARSSISPALLDCGWSTLYGVAHDFIFGQEAWRFLVNGRSGWQLVARWLLPRSGACQTAQQGVSEILRVTYATPSEFDQLMTQSGLQGFFCLKGCLMRVALNRSHSGIESPLQNLSIKRIELLNKRREQVWSPNQRASFMARYKRAAWPFYNLSYDASRRSFCIRIVLASSCCELVNIESDLFSPGLSGSSHNVSL